MDCFDTLDDNEQHVQPTDIRDFLEARAELKDEKGNVVQEPHGAAICQPVEDWSKEHAALEAACQKLGASCSYDIRKMIDSVTGKVSQLGKEPQ